MISVSRVAFPALLALLACATAAAAATRRCAGTVDAATARAGDEKHWLLNGFNQEHGPHEGQKKRPPLPYTDPSFAHAIRRVGVGALRYPGGTIANYWNWTNGTFALPCTNPGPKKNDWCSDNVEFATMSVGPHAYNAANFTAHIAQHLACPRCVSYVANVVAARTVEAMTGMIDGLVAQLPGRDVSLVRHVEIGNELYNEFYDWRYANATAYAKGVAPVVAYIRQRLPFASVSAMMWKETDKPWNAELAPFLRRDSPQRLFDAVVYHDYSLAEPLGNSTAPPSYQVTKILGWGVWRTHDIAATARRLYGPGVPVWVTEFNVWETFDPALLHTVAHAMYTLSYQIGAVCTMLNGASEDSNTTAATRFDALLMHHIWMQGFENEKTQQWWGSVGLPNNATEAATPGGDHNTYNVIAQVLGHVHDVGTAVFDSVACLRFRHDPSALSEDTCPVLPPSLSPFPNNTACLQGIVFANASAASDGAAAVVMNLCGDGAISTTVLTGHAAPGANVTVWEYGAYDSGFGFSSFAGCGGPLWAPAGCDFAGTVPRRLAPLTAASDGGVTFAAQPQRLYILSTQPW